MHPVISCTAVCSAMLMLGNPATLVGRGIGQADAVNFDAKTMVEFQAKVEKYAELHRTIAASLPKVSDSATPEDIDRRQREFGRKMAQARAGAKQGDVFSPSMQAVTRRLMERLFKNAVSRRELRDSVMDDNPSPAQVHVAVNARYPDAVPLSTMPPEVLKNLPPVPKEVEYRFVGDSLILLDPDSHIVVDFVSKALPK